MTTQHAFEQLQVGAAISGPVYGVTAVSIKEFAEASLDYNPLHLDDKYMESDFGKTNFGGVIMHGMTNFALLTRMLVDWAEPLGGVQRRLETRWRVPVKPGDTVQPRATVKSKKSTKDSQYAVVAVEVKNQRDETVATGEALVEFPLA